MINNCTNILVAQAISEQVFDGDTNIYRFQPIENIVGNVSENEIFVYERDIKF